MYEYMDRIGTSPQFRAGAKLLLLTMVRKSELSNAKWSEVNFSEAVWTIPKQKDEAPDAPQRLSIAPSARYPSRA